MGNVNREMETLRKSKKEMVEKQKNTVTENSAFDSLISRLDIVKLVASLKVCPFHFPK